jgi:CCR4-NOT transcription complex subunit 2
MHGSYNIANMSGSLAQRNAAISGLPSSGVQQTGGSMSGRFGTSNLPVAMSQVCDAHLYAYWILFLVLW